MAVLFVSVRRVYSCANLLSAPSMVWMTARSCRARLAYEESDMVSLRQFCPRTVINQDHSQGIEALCAVDGEQPNLVRPAFQMVDQLASLRARCSCRAPNASSGGGGKAPLPVRAGTSRDRTTRRRYGRPLPRLQRSSHRTPQPPGRPAGCHVAEGRRSVARAHRTAGL